MISRPIAEEREDKGAHFENKSLSHEEVLALEAT